MDILVYAVLGGGIGSVFGPVVGSTLLVVLSEVFRVASKLDPLATGSC